MSATPFSTAVAEESCPAQTLTSTSQHASEASRNAAVRSRIQRARIQLMMWQPFLSAAIGAFPLIPSPNGEWCPTMATDGSFIYYNPTWTDGLKDEEIQFVLAHEVMHCVLGHIDRRGDRNATIWNYAIDYATNLLLVDCGLTMPSEGLYDTQYRGMTAEQIYDYLSQNANRIPNNVGAGRLDGHLAPGDTLAASVRKLSRETGEGFVMDSPTESEQLNLRRDTIRQMRSSGKLAGKGSAGLLSEIEASGKPQVDWRPLLAQFVSGLNRDDYRMYPFSKKHLWRGLYLPSVGIPGPKHIVVAVDTSGSMSQKDLELVLTEVDRLRSLCHCELTLIHCDDRIHKVDTFSPYENSQSAEARYSIYGRGGTDLRPPFDWVIKEASCGGIDMPDALIYLTDGYGNFPEKEPPFPVLWITTPSSRAATEYPFGWVIALNDH